MIISLVIGLLLSVFVVTLPWIIVFNAVPVSGDSQYWAQFGDYVGGTLSPLIAALALIALAYTIRQQQEQISQLRKQSAKEDLLRTIDKLEEDFNRWLTRYPKKISFRGKVLEFSGIDVLFSPSFMDYKEVMVSKEEILSMINKEGDENSLSGFEREDQRIFALEMFGMAAGELNQIRLYASKLDELSGNNAMSKYYQRKYNVAYKRFLERGFLKEPWIVDDKI